MAYDRRGFGRSTWQPKPFSHVTDLRAVMDALDLPSAVLVGNSQGGRISLDTALANPDRVDGLVLIGSAVTGAPHPFGEDADPVEDEMDQAADDAVEAGDLDRANQLEAHLWLDGPRQPEGRIRGPARQLFDGMNGTALSCVDTGQATWGQPAWPRLDQITAPTLIVTGRHDMTVINEWSRHLARTIPSATLIELADSAHLPMLDDAEGFTAATLPFLDGLLHDLLAGGSTPPDRA